MPLSPCLGHIGKRRCGRLCVGSRCPECAAELRQGLNRLRNVGSPYQSPAHRRFRVQVLARDQCCLVCKSEENPHAHHIDGVEAGFEISNGMRLCGRCHRAYEADVRAGRLTVLVRRVRELGELIKSLY